ncbi:MAG: hypothetical protein ACM3QU_13215 [Verrucomicrobiota bacterium]
MNLLHRIALSTSLLAVAGLAVSIPTVLAGMHPQLAARLAGMGEHGIVNLTVNRKGKKLCWTFDVPTKGITRAAIHTRAKGTVLVRLGTTYAKKGCTTASEMTLEHLESAPARYSVWIDTKGHPGDLRGMLFAGMAHM